MLLFSGKRRKYITNRVPPGLVLDPFTGSGSSLLAAKMLGRGYLGIELDAKYHAIAQRNLPHARGAAASHASATEDYANGAPSIGMGITGSRSLQYRPSASSTLSIISRQSLMKSSDI
jgi:hypothetical protein